MKYESNILERLIKTYGVVGNPKYVSEIIKQFIIQGKECYPNLFTYQADWLAHIDEFGLSSDYVVSYTGQHIYAPNTKEKPVKRAILKGQTLVNLFPNLLTGEFKKNTTTKDGDSLIFSKGSALELGVDKIKTSTTYTFILDIKENTLVGNGDLFQVVHNGTSISSTAATLTNEVGLVKLKTTTLNNLAGKKISLYVRDNVTSGEIKIKSVMLLEGDYTNVDIPYFDGMQSVKMPVLTSVSSTNLYVMDELLDEKVIISNFENSSTDFIKVYPNEKIFFSTQKDYNYARFYDENKQPIGDYIMIAGWNPTDGYFGKSMSIVPENGRYLKVFIRTNRNWEKLTMVNRGEDYLPYEKGKPYKSNILTVNEDVTLRSNGSVHDELDLLTGKLTQRIDENGEVLSQEIVKTVDLNIKDHNQQKVERLTSFEGGTHFTTSSQTGTLLPTLEVDVVVDLEETLMVCSAEGNTM